uniref:Envelope glycoprotein UL37 n=1 Tax=Mastomys natalensis cytomegalovirus 2 TaxID=2973540 RepID=A0A9Y1IMB8_9BETA|nr:envelope glycoprotein UL37 [Mastomys natalensis cytomegalovirus 2]WEG69178.1 envelope glycoprotein UL37 [Mastomys natalensis cytomegalovirus 2]WEG69317.1 envelope glycoprotein UL37 [Mastomys natalensis cytomegalovirus 2]WEG69455.1 envelope glycoprotein UL37 [Mastomys natalensis cytomegalovirus 2]WEG69593.1 envelope glycoprotein UL37 [Mastomys natalensis cytomegalovirus 2]
MSLYINLVRRYDRFCVICLFVLQITMASGAPNASVTFECSYDVCLIYRRDGRTTVGCVVSCAYGREIVFSGNCRESFLLVSSWFGKANKRRGFRDIRAIKTGLAYYFSGYILRPLSSRTDVVSPTIGRVSLSGVAQCWRRGSLSGGYVELNTKTMGSYRLVVEPEDVEPSWIARDGGSAEVVEILMQNVTRDIRVFQTCTELVNAVAIGHTSDSVPKLLQRTAIVRKDACSGGAVLTDWSHMWMNWTKYCELDEGFHRDSGFIVSVQGHTSSNRIPKLVGLFVVVFGAFALLALFFCMSLKQRRSLYRDFRGETSLKIKGEPFIENGEHRKDF